MARESFMGRPVTRNSPAEFAKNIAEEAISPVKKLGEAMAPYADKAVEVGRRLFGSEPKQSPAETQRRSDTIKRTLDERQKGKR